MSRLARSRTPRSARLFVLALPVVVAVGVLPATQAEASTVRARVTASTSWFHDPLTAMQRAALVPVPEHPRSVHGKLQSTQALWKSHGGGFAVPAVTAQGHLLQQGQAVTLSRRNLFAPGSAAPTMAARARVTTLAVSLSRVTAVTCEGYTDFGGDAAREARLARKRAATICGLLATARPGLDTTTRGFGRQVPVLVGGTSSQRAANRRVVVVATEGLPATPPPANNVAPTIPPVTPPQDTVAGAPTLGSVAGGVNQASLTFAAPASDGGSPITGYEWSTDQTTWTPLTTTGSSPYTVQLSSLLAGTATYYVRAVNAIGNGPASSGSAASVTDPVVLDVPNAPSWAAANYRCNGTVQQQDTQINSNPSFSSVTITGVQYRVDSGPWTDAVDPQLVAGIQYQFSTTLTTLCAGTPVVQVRYTSANGPGPAITANNYRGF